jgi:hypothetical protein
MPPLDVKKTMAELTEMYKASPVSQKTNFLLYGGMGTGKTTMAVETSRRPVLVHSFDPGGIVSINPELIESGVVLVDTRYEVESPKDPKAFKAWDDEFFRLLNGGFFPNIGTYVVDSGTTWSAAAMNEVLKKAGRKAGVPQQNDYLPQMTLLENALKVICSLPCDVVFICHEKADQDAVTGKMHAAPLLTGKLTTRVPLLFDEIYHLVAKETSKGTEFSAQTQPCSTYQARTRIGRRGLLDKFENPDIKYILKKCKRNSEDVV